MKFIFEPIYINKTEIKNRIVYPALNLLYSVDGTLNERHKAFYSERARGGAGIVTVGPVGIGEMGSGPTMLSIASDSDIPAFAAIARIIQSQGARAWMQLFHAGAYMRPDQLGGRQPLGPSAVYNMYSKVTPREMSLDDILNVQEDFARCAERAQQAGFDGIEVIASAGYLLSQFLSPLRNKREDQYGGSLDNRARLAREIIEKMRSRLGRDYPITIRMSGNDFVPGSNSDSVTPAVARLYQSAGVDAVNVTGGWHESKVPQITMALPRGGFAYLSQSVKGAVRIPVMASNRIADPLTAEMIIRDGWADMVSLGRVLLADPFWPLKAQNGQIRRIRPCVACMQGCMDQLYARRPVTCTINPRTGFEETRTIKSVIESRRVMVIGAGPGGLEASWRAAKAGHRVRLYEKADQIGGQLRLAGAPPHRHEFLQLITYFQAMLDHYNVETFLNTPVDLDLILDQKPDYIIAAEGATVSVPSIQGIDGSGIINAWEVLGGKQKLGRRIAVIGGGGVGLETAHYIASQGTISAETLLFLFQHQAESPTRLQELLTNGNKQVTIFERAPQVGRGVGRSTKWGLIADLNRYGVQFVQGADVISVKNGIVEFEIGQDRRSATFDNIINATGAKPVRELADLLPQTRIPFSIIGDSVTPGHMSDAIHQAFQVVMNELK